MFLKKQTLYNLCKNILFSLGADTYMGTLERDHNHMNTAILFVCVSSVINCYAIKKFQYCFFFVSQDLDEAAVDRRDVQRIHLPVKLVDYDIAETQTPNPLLSVKCFFVGSLSRASAS